jgi:AcrR family transcriptional regulator
MHLLIYLSPSTISAKLPESNLSARPRQRLPVAERRAVVIEAAGRLFGERGYEATRLDDVAAAAGVTKPIVYRHFDSKRDLYLALLDRHRDDLAGFVASIPAEGTTEQRLRAVLEVWLDYVEARSYAWKMLFRDTGGGPEIGARRREVHAEARAVLVDLIRSLAATPVSRRAVLDSLTTAWVKLLA